METYHKIQTLFKRDMDGSLTGKKGKMIQGEWTTPELDYLALNEWEFTEKVDGTNIRIGYDLDPHHLDRVEFAGRSDNAVIPTHLLEHLEATFTTDKFKAAGLNNVILFGEGYGVKIQNGGTYMSDRVDFVLFDVKIGNWWLHRDDVDDIAAKLGIASVPVIGYGDLYDGIDLVTDGLHSHLGRSVNAEGIVARPKVPMFDRKGERIITKIKEVDFR